MDAAAELHEKENLSNATPRNQAAAGKPSSQLASCYALMANPDNNTDLLKYVARSLKEEKEFHFLRFESLQRTNIVAQQLRLLEIKQKLQNARDVSADDLEELKNTLKDYSKNQQKDRSTQELCS